MDPSTNTATSAAQMPWCSSGSGPFPASGAQRKSYCDWNLFDANGVPPSNTAWGMDDVIIGCRASSAGEVTRLGTAGDGSSSASYAGATQYNLVASL